MVGNMFLSKRTFHSPVQMSLQKYSPVSFFITTKVAQAGDFHHSIHLPVSGK